MGYSAPLASMRHELLCIAGVDFETERIVT